MLDENALRYRDLGPIDCSTSINLDKLKGKTVLVTGGERPLKCPDIGIRGSNLR